MIVLGLDPSTTAFGWALVESNGHQLRIVRSGVLKPKAGKPKAERMAAIWRALVEIIAWHPDGPDEELLAEVVAVEEGFASASNQGSALVVGMARGHAYTLAGLNKLTITGYPPSTVKKAITGRGNAKKPDMLRAVNALFPDDEAHRIVSDDQADAIAVAVTYLNEREVVTMLERMNARSTP